MPPAGTPSRPRSVRRRSLALAVLLLAAVPALAALPAVLAVPAAAAEVGTLWRVREGAGTVYTAGSLHQLRRDRAGLPPSYGLAYGEAERLALELNMDAISPAVLAGELVTRALDSEGRSLREGLPRTDQIQLLEVTLKELDGIGPRLDALEAAWRAGDLSRLEALLLGDSRQRPDLFERLVMRRNAAWVAPVRGFLKRPDDTLVVVGLMHLLGDRGLIALLRQQGLQPERFVAGAWGRIPRPGEPRARGRRPG
jgi:uncharacterized protein YbaP (TraB family)